MKLLSASILWGGNVHHGTAVIRQEVDLGALAGLRSGRAGPEFAARFVDRFGGLRTVNIDGALPADFLDRLHSATGAPFIDVLLRAILAVEDAMAFTMRRLGTIAFAEVMAGPAPERALLVWSCRSPGLSRRAAEVGLAGLRELLPEELRWPRGAGQDGFGAAYRSLRTFAERRRLPFNLGILLHSAEKKGVPWEPMVGSFIRLGQGKFQHPMQPSATGKTTIHSIRLAKDKQNTNRVLADMGLPVPQQATVATIEEAAAAAVEIGYPVVIKPLNGQGGTGVTAGLQGPDEIAPAFERARRSGPRVLVESFIEGTDHRLMIVGGQFVAAAKRVPPSVTGDGTRAIGALIEELNADPLRDGWRRRQVTVDEELERLLKAAGYGLDTVLEKGETMVLRSTANISTGGVPVDITDSVHPDNQELAIRAAAALGLHLAGVDFMTSDISRSYKEIGAAIIEVNGQPNFRPHTWPGQGEPRDVAGALMDSMFPSGSQGRVPVALIAGDRRSDTAARHLDRLLRSAGTAVALVVRAGAFINGEPAGPENARHREATRSVLRDPRVEAMVGTVSPRRVLKRGLVHEACEVAAIMETGYDEDEAETRHGLDVLVRATRGTLAVDADSTEALEAVQGIDPERLVLVSPNTGNAAVRHHVAAGGAAARTGRKRGDRVIVLIEDNRTVLSLPIAAVPHSSEEDSRERLCVQLFSVALAYAMGCPAAEIVSAFESPQPPETAQHFRTAAE